MPFSDEAVQLQCPVLEAGLTVDDLFALHHDHRPGNSASHNSGEEGSSRAVYSVDERKRRRMISNRQSARRSRWRKKRHLEDLSSQLNRLRLENRALKNRFGLVAQRCHVAWRENDRLGSEFLALRSRLSDLLQILDIMQYSHQLEHATCPFN